MQNTPQAMYMCMFDTEKHTLTHRRASTEGPCRRGQPPPEAKTPLPHTSMVSRRHHFGLQSIGLDYRDDNNLPSHGRCSQQRMCWRQRISSIRHQTQKCGRVNFLRPSASPASTDLSWGIPRTSWTSIACHNLAGMSYVHSLGRYRDT